MRLKEKGLARAITGVFAYQVLAFWLPMPIALACLPTLRMMGKQLPPPGRAKTG